MNNPTTWIIESDTRGTFIEWRANPKDWRGAMVPRFSTTGTRRERSKLFPSEASVRCEWEKVRRHVKNCYVVELGDGYAQIAYDLRGFTEASERELQSFCWTNKLSGTARQIDRGLEWSLRGHIVAMSIFREATNRQHHYLASEFVEGWGRDASVKPFLTRMAPADLDRIAADMLGADVATACRNKVAAVIEYCRCYGLNATDLRARYPELNHD